jgi:hypothetical protein
MGKVEFHCHCSLVMRDPMASISSVVYSCRDPPNCNLLILVFSSDPIMLISLYSIVRSTVAKSNDRQDDLANSESFSY